MDELKDKIANDLEPKFRGIGVGFSKAIAKEITDAALRAIEDAGYTVVRLKHLERSGINLEEPRG